jgi:hypothetical protein
MYSCPSGSLYDNFPSRCEPVVYVSSVCTTDTMCKVSTNERALNLRTLGAEDRGNNLIASRIRVRGMSHDGMYAFLVQLGLTVNLVRACLQCSVAHRGCS